MILEIKNIRARAAPNLLPQCTKEQDDFLNSINNFELVQLFNTSTKAIKLSFQEVNFTIAYVIYIFGVVDGNKQIEVSKGGRKTLNVADRLFPINEKLVGSNEQVDVEDTI